MTYQFDLNTPEKFGANGMATNGALVSSPTNQTYPGLGKLTRADIAAANSAYGWVATHPFSKGDDILVRVPSPVVSGQTVVPLATTQTVTNGSYVGGDGHTYLPWSNANKNSYPGMTGVFGSSGFTVLSTATNCVQITDGTVVPTNTSVSIGQDMSKLTAGMEVWGTGGLSARTAIASVDTKGRTITLTKPTASTPVIAPLGTGTTNGLMFMQNLTIFTSLDDSTLGQNMTMDFLGFMSAVYAHGGPSSNATVSVTALGNYVMKPHAIISGIRLSLKGLGREASVFSGTNNSPVISYWPAFGAFFEMTDFTVNYYSGYADAAVHIDGCGFSEYAPNENGSVSFRMDNLGVSCAGTNAGSRCNFKLRNLGAGTVNLISGSGPSRTVAGSCVFDLGNIVLCSFTNINAYYHRSAFQQSLYSEHLSIDKLSVDQCGALIDMSLTSQYNGLGALLFNISNIDADVNLFGMILRSVQQYSISNIAVAGGGGSAVDWITVLGGNNGTIVGVQGATSGRSCIALLAGQVDGGYYPSSQTSVSAVNVTNFLQALDIRNTTAVEANAVRNVNFSKGYPAFTANPVLFTANSGNIVNGTVV